MIEQARRRVDDAFFIHHQRWSGVLAVNEDAFKEGFYRPEQWINVELG